MSLKYVDDFRCVCGYVVGGWVSYGFKFGLVFGVRLKACRGFEDVVVALRALFIYLVFFFRRGSASLRLALFMTMAMTLLHKDGMSSRLGGYGSCRTSLACVRVCLVCWGSVVVGVLVFGLRSMFFAVFLSRVMRFSCLVSDLVIRGFSFMFVSLKGG